MNTPKPGVYKSVPASEYHAWKLPSKSALVHARKSLAHMRAYMDGPHESTSAMDFGSWFHARLLEPELYRSMAAVGPDADKNTKPWKEFAAANVGKWLLKPSESDAIEAMASRVLAIPCVAAAISGNNLRELSCVFDDPHTGVRCKCRIDLMSPAALVEIKTTVCAEPRAFAADSWKRGYWLGAALYRRAIKTLYGRNMEWIVPAVEKAPPYEAVAYRFDDQGMAIAEMELNVLLRRVKAAQESGEWPGYPNTLTPLPAPRWAGFGVGDESEEWRYE